MLVTKTEIVGEHQAMDNHDETKFTFKSRLRPLKRQIEDIFSVSELINVVDSNVGTLKGMCEFDIF